MHWTKVNEAIGSETDSAARAAVNRLKQRFKEADPMVSCDPLPQRQRLQGGQAGLVPEKSERQKKYASSAVRPAGSLSKRGGP
jgi:hypothetical protein